MTSMPRKVSLPSHRRRAAIIKVTSLVTITILATYIASVIIENTESNRDTLKMILAVPVLALLIWTLISLRLPRPSVPKMPKREERREREVVRRLSPRRWETAVREAGLAIEDRSDLDRLVIHTPRITGVTPVPLGLALTVEAIPGQAPEDIRKRIPQLASALSVPLVFRAIGARTVQCTAKLWEPLAEVTKTPDFPGLDVDRMALQYGVREDGEPAVWEYANKGGAVAGGEPGAGKTSFATMAVGPLLLSQYAEVHILDGKGGQDWNWAKPAADFYSSEVRDLTAAVEHVEGLVNRMRDLAANVPEGAESNFWNRPRTPDQPFVLLVVDECQVYFNAKGLKGTAKELVDRFTVAIELLVRLGRSVGFFVFLMTQKPTSDSIPTSIRDNVGPRICFRVNTLQAETAVLGEAPSALEDPARATQIPDTQPGRAVIAQGPRRLHVRVAYLPETTAAQRIKEMTS